MELGIFEIQINIAFSSELRSHQLGLGNNPTFWGVQSLIAVLCLLVPPSRILK